MLTLYICIKTTDTKTKWPPIGGMHTLMSIIGAVGTLMSNSGLEEVMNSAFAWVPKMLSGKKFLQNVRAHLVTEELLRAIIADTESHAHLSTESRTGNLWVDNLIKPVIIMMLFVRGEREKDTGHGTSLQCR